MELPKSKTTAEKAEHEHGEEKLRDDKKKTWHDQWKYAWLTSKKQFKNKNIKGTNIGWILDKKRNQRAHKSCIELCSADVPTILSDEMNEEDSGEVFES